MKLDTGDPAFHRRTLTVERQFQGSVLDVADARRFSRLTASWWGIEPDPIEHVVDELSRHAVCSQRPAFKVLLTLDRTDVKVQVIATEPEAPVVEGPARIRSMRPRGPARRP